MTDFASSSSISIGASRLRRAAPSRRVVLLAAVMLAVGASATLVASSQVAAVDDAELLMLLRFMAATKAIMAAAAVTLIWWRLGFAASAMLACGYALAATTMAAAPVLMWQFSYVAAGAILFHVGGVILLGAAWADRGDVSTLGLAVARRLRRT